MSLKATFTEGSDTTIVRGLYQWDYGRVLEIESVDIGSEIVEVHFACSNMDEAIVRSCAFTDGVGTVTIPNACLEQSTPLTAWVYLIHDTQGYTTKTITLPIIARTRPSVAPDIPAEISNRYTELITEINEAVNALEKGNITVAKAADATNASHATSAGNAGTANFATTAQVAQYASADTSKGTIEERLTALGFKEGVVTPSSTDSAYYTEHKNIIQRQGNYVIGHFRANTYFSVSLGTVPKEFRPATAKTFYGHIKALTNNLPVTGEAEIEITSDGNMRVSAFDFLNENSVIIFVSVSFGYNAAT